jgi:hypothetical protein
MTSIQTIERQSAYLNEKENEKRPFFLFSILIEQITD